MLFRTSTSTIIVAVLATVVFAAQCDPGQYRDSDGFCVACQDGSISVITSPDGDSQYSCIPCVVGETSDPTHTSCVKCDPGYYNSLSGGSCIKCGSGTFNNVSGAKSCCQCCAASGKHSERTLCNKCPADRPYSAPGSNQNSDCTATYNSGDPNPVSSCAMVADNVCPNPTSSGPIGTAISRKKRDLRCTQGYDACPRYSGRGGFDCVDTENDPESCGGCISLDGQGAGTDCTAIKGAGVTRCVKRSCVVDSCRNGWVRSIDGASCVLVPESSLRPLISPLQPPRSRYRSEEEENFIYQTSYSRQALLTGTFWRNHVPHSLSVPT